MAAPEGYVRVKLNGNYKTNVDGEFAWFPKEEAEYLTSNKYVKGEKAGQHYAKLAPFSPDEKKFYDARG